MSDEMSCCDDHFGQGYDAARKHAAEDIARLRQALMEIAELEEVFLDTAPQIAKAALRADKG